MNKTKSLLSKIGMILVVLLVGVNTVNAQWCQQPNPNFCPGNRFTNGNFEIVTGNPGPPEHQDINLATGWLAPWGTSSNNFADLACGGTVHRTGKSMEIPTPNSGIYAGMWIIGSTNINENGDYREGMYNRLTSPILRNSGNYSFNFDVSRGINLSLPPVKIAIYGVSNPSGLIAPAPTSLFSPNNLNLFGAGNVVKLGTVTTPVVFNNSWSSVNFTFNTATWSKDITHILITSDDLPASVWSKQYVNFDNFCMRSEAPLPPFDECLCPPDTLHSSIADLFRQDVITSQLNNYTYKLIFDYTNAFQNMTNAWDNFIRTYYGLAPNTEVSIHQFMLYEVNGGIETQLGDPFWVSSTNGGFVHNNDRFSTVLQANKKYKIKHGVYYGHNIPYDEKCGWKESNWNFSVTSSANKLYFNSTINGKEVKKEIKNIKN